MLVTHDLLDQLEKADEIMEKICELHKKGEDIAEETKIFNYIHGIIAKTEYELTEQIEKYKDLESWRKYETNNTQN